MTKNETPMSQYDRMLAILEGRKPDRYPFIGRLELWQAGLRYTHSMPDKYAHMDLTDIHRDIGYGRHRMQDAYVKKYHGVEMVVTFNGEEVQHETDPLLYRMPDVRSEIPDGIGDTLVEFRTQIGTLTVEYRALESMLATGARAYMTKHPITSPDDYPIVEHIIENTELIPAFDVVTDQQREFGKDGWVVASLERVPFQQLLIDFIDTSDFFFVMHDNPKQIQRLLDILGEQVIEAMRLMEGLRHAICRDRRQRGWHDDQPASFRALQHGDVPYAQRHGARARQANRQSHGRRAKADSAAITRLRSGCH